jgi:hypothetical protein
MDHNKENLMLGKYVRLQRRNFRRAINLGFVLMSLL